MCNKIKYLLFFIASFLFFSNLVSAQIKITSIQIEGNRKTKPYIILRELPYHEGDMISKDSLSILDTVSEQQLYNTSLFVQVTVHSEAIDSNQVVIKINVSERWYLFPIPYFRWVDRNFSQWWNDQNRSLDRVNYGFNLRQANVSGNNDKLTAAFITGYTQQSIFRYQIPFIDKKLRYGLALGWQNFTQKEINIDTKLDKQVFYKTNNIIQEGYRANASLLYRPNLYDRGSFQIGIGKNEISDSAFLYQANFLPSHQKIFSYVDASLSFSRFHFDYNAYPTQGQSTDVIFYHRFSKNSNLSSIQLKKMWAYPFTKSNFVFFESNTLVKFLSNQNYTDNKLLGYGNLQMNGLEYYVVDGNAASILKASYQHALGTVRIKNALPMKSLPFIKYQFWFKAFTHLGYVYSERPLNNSRLANTLIRTAGLGLDIISIYDFVLKIDYSLNQLGDKGLYLHTGINF
ncbi:MAG: POTRA domain-containing protein [Chitinophagia bacterium]